jgi:hypothetical protein
MAQSVGYLLAAGGPSLFGVLRDATGSWKVPLALLLAITVCLLIAGLGASRLRRNGLTNGRPRTRHSKERYPGKSDSFRHNSLRSGGKNTCGFFRRVNQTNLATPFCQREGYATSAV